MSRITKAPQSGDRSQSVLVCTQGSRKLSTLSTCGGIYCHEHEVFMEVEALKEAANSLATHDNLLLFGCIYLEICLGVCIKVAFDKDI